MHVNTAAAPAEHIDLGIPLAVDLDGTLLRTDLLVESALLLLRRNPFSVFAMLWWLRRGKAHLKAEIARRVSPAFAALPFRRVVLEYLQAARGAGRRIVLATASDAVLAAAVAQQVGLFDEVMASDGHVNLSGEAKRRRLVAAYGERGYDYLGSDRQDLAPWRSARVAVLVAPGAALQRRARCASEFVQVLPDSRATVFDWLRALRVHHWLKNSLLFVPLLAAHRLDEPRLVAIAGLAALAFGLGASAAYLLNDLLDLEADRHHPHKRLRPIPAGRIPPAHVLAALCLLAAAVAILSWQLPATFGAALALYCAGNLAYSLRLKFVPILDVLVLAGFYALRILAGGAAVGIEPSAKLLTFAMFLFLSLALVKRYAELVVMRTVDGPQARARGYQFDDAELLAALGGGAGYLAVLVLALYINTTTSHALYQHPRYLWALCPLLLYWITHLWLVAHRRRMHDDPLIFALRDPMSLLLLALMGLTLMIAL